MPAIWKDEDHTDAQLLWLLFGKNQDHTDAQLLCFDLER